MNGVYNRRHGDPNGSQNVFIGHKSFLLLLVTNLPGLGRLPGHETGAQSITAPFFHQGISMPFHHKVDKAPITIHHQGSPVIFDDTAFFLRKHNDIVLVAFAVASRFQRVSVMHNLVCVWPMRNKNDYQLDYTEFTIDGYDDWFCYGVDKFRGNFILTLANSEMQFQSEKDNPRPQEKII